MAETRTAMGVRFWVNSISDLSSCQSQKNNKAIHSLFLLLPPIAHHWPPWKLVFSVASEEEFHSIARRDQTDQGGKWGAAISYSDPFSPHPQKVYGRPQSIFPLPALMSSIKRNGPKELCLEKGGGGKKKSTALKPYPLPPRRVAVISP